MATMPGQFEEIDETAMSEILSRAVKKHQAVESGVPVSRMDELIAAAGELGIAPEAIREAEREYREERTQVSDLDAYQAHLRQAFKSHLVSYVSVCATLTLVNLLTYKESDTLWVLYVIFGWGIGVAANAVATFRKVEWNDDEFQSWRKEKVAAISTNDLPAE